MPESGPLRPAGGGATSATCWRRRTPAGRRRAPTEPVLLVPGFMAGDWTLRADGPDAAPPRVPHLPLPHPRQRRLHRRNAAACSSAGSSRSRSGASSRVRIVGHSLGGMLARGLAVRRPDLVSGIVTMGSPMLAPGAPTRCCSPPRDTLVRLSRAGVPNLMSEDCVAGACARASFDESRAPLPPGSSFTAIYSRGDGMVDCGAVHRPAGAAVRGVRQSPRMAIDPRVLDVVVGQLTDQQRRRPRCVPVRRRTRPAQCQKLRAKSGNCASRCDFARAFASGHTDAQERALRRADAHFGAQELTPRRNSSQCSKSMAA